jgi:ABC-type multidrug transport system fused ATPase/permease subunit
MAKRNKNNKKKRPIAVSVIAAAIVVLFLIHMLQVVTLLISENLFKGGITDSFIREWRLTDLGNALLSSATYLILSVAGIITLIGFLRLRRWSWVLLMSWTGLSLVISLVDYFYSHANYLVMASNVVIAFALNIPDVQRMFGIRRDYDPAR